MGPRCCARLRPDGHFERRQHANELNACGSGLFGHVQQNLSGASTCRRLQFYTFLKSHDEFDRSLPFFIVR
jgi:hypothetical protein